MMMNPMLSFSIRLAEKLREAENLASHLLGQSSSLECDDLDTAMADAEAEAKKEGEVDRE